MESPRSRSSKPNLPSLARGPTAGTVRDFSAPPDLDAGSPLVMDFGEAVLRTPMGQAECSINFHDYSAGVLFTNTSGIYCCRKSSQGWDAPRTCIIDIFGREHGTNRSVALSVEFSPSICIEFDEQVTNPNAMRAVHKLRKLMISTAVHRSLSKPINKAIRGDIAKRKKARNLVCYWTKVVRGMRMDSCVSFHVREFGFYPDLAAPEGVLRLKKFPMLTVFFSTVDDANLLAETLFLHEQTTLQGWRRCNEKLAPLLDFIVRGNLEPGGTFEVRPDRFRLPKRSYFHTDREFVAKFDPTRDKADTIFKRRDDLAMHIPDRVIFSWDLECVDPNGGFPNPRVKSNEVICIGVSVYSTANNATRSLMLALPGVSSDRIMNTTREEGGESDMDPWELRTFDTEPEMFEGLRDLIIETDPDIIFGWNIWFDYEFVRDRINAHYPEMHKTSRFFYQSRIISQKCKFVEQTTTTSANGTKTKVSMRVPGRIVMDLMTYVAELQDVKFSQYSLDYVSSQLLGKESGKTHFSIPEMMDAWFSEDPVRRRRVALYCVQDTIVPIKIWNELFLHSRTIMESRVTSTPQERIINGGQQVRNYSLLYRLAVDNGIMLNRNPESPAYEPTFRLKDIAQGKRDATRTQMENSKEDILCELKEIRARLKKRNNLSYTKRQKESDNMRRVELIASEKAIRIALTESKFEGAVVLDVKRGIYTMVVTLDFKSLYPSIIIRYNLDTSTMVTDKRFLNLPGWVYETIVLGEDGKKVVIVQNIKGLVPLACETLLNARGVAKKLMKAAPKGSVERRNRDGQQKALKVTGNSLYGGWGVSWLKGRFVCRELARAVTSCGRNLIYRTRDTALEMYSGPPFNAEIVMGDTDSVFVKFDCSKDLAGRRLAWDASVKLGERCNIDFNTREKPMIIELEVEKIYEDISVLAKKRYTGMKRDDPEQKNATLDCKGDMEVRRDASDAEKEVFAACKKKLFFGGKDVDGASALLVSGLQRMVSRKLPMSKYSRTCKMRDVYNSKTAQGCARDRANARRPGSGARSGSRMSFVFVWPRGADANNPPPKYDMSEVLEFAEDPENKQEIDVLTYVEHMKNRVVDLFDLCGASERALQIFAQAEAIAGRIRSKQSVLDPSDLIIRDLPNASSSATCLGLREHNISKEKRKRLVDARKNRVKKKGEREELQLEKQSMSMAAWFNSKNSQKRKAHSPSPSASVSKAISAPAATKRRKKAASSTMLSHWFSPKQS